MAFRTEFNLHFLDFFLAFFFAFLTISCVAYFEVLVASPPHPLDKMSLADEGARLPVARRASEDTGFMGYSAAKRLSSAAFNNEVALPLGTDRMPEQFC